MKCHTQRTYVASPKHRLSSSGLTSSQIPASTCNPLMPGRRTYNTAASAWPRSGRLVIESVLDTTIAKFPLNFLETCGDNTWSYVSYVVSLLVEADPQYPGHIVWPENGHPVDSQCAPVAGMFKYVEQGPSPEHIVGIASLSVTGKSSDVHFTRGPTFYTSVIPASGQEGSSVSDQV